MIDLKRFHGHSGVSMGVENFMGLDPFFFKFHWVLCNFMFRVAALQIRSVLLFSVTPEFV